MEKRRGKGKEEGTNEKDRKGEGRRRKGKTLEGKGAKRMYDVRLKGSLEQVSRN